MRAARIVAIVTLLFLALSAIAGALPMLTHPTGGPGLMPLTLLQHSPFHSFLIPALLLLSANGLLSLWALFLTVQRHPGYGWWVGAQGFVLTGWLVVEIVIMYSVDGLHWLQILYGIVALVLIVAGVVLVRGGTNVSSNRLSIGSSPIHGLPRATRQKDS